MDRIALLREIFFTAAPEDTPRRRRVLTLFERLARRRIEAGNRARYAAYLEQG